MAPQPQQPVAGRRRRRPRRRNAGREGQYRGTRHSRRRRRDIALAERNLLPYHVANDIRTSHVAASRAFASTLHEVMDSVNCSGQPFPVLRFTVDEIVATSVRVLKARSAFAAAGKPFNLDIAYHYTPKENLPSIRMHGVMNEEERAAMMINARVVGATYGKGIYTASNPYAYHGQYGDVCILMARLPGTNHDFSSPDETNEGWSDSVTAHRGEPNEIMIVSGSSQCIPILCFDTTLIDAHGWWGNMLVDNYHIGLLNALNETFNSEIATPFPHHLLKLQPQYSSFSGQSEIEETIEYVPPQYVGLPHATCFWVDHYHSATIPQDLMVTLCSACRCLFQPPQWATRLEVIRCWNAGNEIRHLSCSNLPGSSIEFIQGKMPAGTMVVSRTTDQVPMGLASWAESIEIEYDIPPGTQQFYHLHPGAAHDGTQRIAYLPDTREGHDLLKRLKYAFRHGLTFTVGISMTSGMPNAVTWSSIPHKTSLTGGIQNFGFPDHNYFVNCHKELDALYVPSARSLT
jgi:Deltex C-terminal domain